MSESVTADGIYGAIALHFRAHKTTCFCLEKSSTEAVKDYFRAATNFLMVTIERGDYLHTGKILNELRHAQILRTYCNSLEYRPLELAIANTDLMMVKLLLDVTGWEVEDRFVEKATTSLMTHYLQQKKTKQAQNQHQTTGEAAWPGLLTPFGLLDYAE